VIGEYRLAVESVGVSALHGVHGSRSGRLPKLYPGVDRLGGGYPGDANAGGRIFAPGEVDLFGRAVNRVWSCAQGA